MSKIVADYESLTGESFESALKRLARNGCCGFEAAQFIGFSAKQGLDYAMRIRGISITFRNVKLPGKSDRAKRYAKAKLKKPKPLTITQSVKGEHPWRVSNRRNCEDIRIRNEKAGRCTNQDGN